MNTPIPDDKLTEIEAALRQGQKIQAIKLYRECTGAGLAEAKAAVEKLEIEPRSGSGTPVKPGDTLAGVREALFRGQKILAIRLYRESTGMGLAEAKRAVEKMEAELRSTSPEQFVVTSSGKGCFGMAVMICVMVVGGILWLAWKYASNETANDLRITHDHRKMLCEMIHFAFAESQCKL